MRTAAEIMKTHLGGNVNLATLTTLAFSEIINVARKEAIEECMKQSQIICKEANYDGGNLKVEYCVDMDVYKLLIDELK